ncbi:MAG: crotonase/enoyl-CoA hydratase family protein [Alcanivoracaceae bacterium]|nr:crotonase/enoyl-CoA hydratase family protein [Alcanivoracaceae bacterium]
MSENSTTAQVRIEKVGTIAHVILSRPEKHNGMDMVMLKAVITAAKKLAGDKEIRAVILRGDGPSFCAGLDFKTVMGQPAKAALAYTQLWWPMRNDFQSWSMAWREVGVPVIAAIHGNCFGAGIQLAMGADIRVTTPDAKISIMEAKWGLIPDMGGVALMRELVRIDVAKELTMSGRIISGDEAAQLGLVTHVAADPVEKAIALAEEMAVRSPDSVAAAKYLLQEGWHAPEDETLSSERRWQRRVMGGKNQRAAVKGNTKKEAPSFSARSVK